MKFRRIKKTLHFKNIDWQDQKFCMSYYYNSSLLKQSILNVGILNFPLLQPISRDRYRIISGWRRFSVLKESNFEPFETFVLDESVPDYQLFDLVLHENLSVRDFNLIEKAYIIKTLEIVLKIETEKIQKTYLPLLSLGHNPRWIIWLKQLLIFPSEVQQAFAEDKLSYDLIEYIEKFKDDEKIVLTKLILSLNLSKSRQKELMLLIDDLLRIKNSQLAELLEQADILKDQKMTYSQKTAKFFEWLKTQRFPNYSEMEKKIQKTIHKLNPPRKVQVKHSPYFESDWLSLQFQFRNAEEFKNVVQFQSELISEQKIDQLFEMINGL